MNKTEANSLKSVVRGRFKLLRAQLQQREEHVLDTVRRQMIENSKADLEWAAAESAKLQAELDAIEEKGKKLMREAADRGVVCYSGHVREPVNPVRNQAVFDEWFPFEIEIRAREEVRRLREQAGMATLDLEREEIMLLEELIVGNIESQDAKEFMDRLPTLEKVLPMPKQPVAIGEGK